MSTKSKYNINEIRKSNNSFSRIRSIIETAFYNNNTKEIQDLKTAYNLAESSPYVIKTDMPVYGAESIGLDSDARVLVFNNGKVVGRTADARKILAASDVDGKIYSEILLDATFNTINESMLIGRACVGMDEEFMVKANLLVPEKYSHILYSWLVNFTWFDEKTKEKYNNSKYIDNESDIYIYADPDWKHEDYPRGLSFFDTERNCAYILGLKYFGEFKKATLTLFWAMATRNGYVACHGGQKRFTLKDGKKFTLGVFGLSGSGKSTITHANHDNKYDITVLHDDSFIINLENASSLAIEKTYFDKTEDYPTDHVANKYVVVAHNVGVTKNNEGKLVIVTEDIRNDNGRCIKSEFLSKSKISKFEEPINAIVWLMRDDSLPPVLKVTKPDLASLMGATLSTRRTKAERIRENMSYSDTVVEPYANPFRTYQLHKDYDSFKYLFETKDIDCYIINTGHFLYKKITPDITLDIIEKIIEGTANFKKWNNFNGLEIFEIDGYVPNLEDSDYIAKLKASIENRIDYIEKSNSEKGRLNRLPLDTIVSLINIYEQI